MAHYLKAGIAPEKSAEADARVRSTVESILSEVAARGDTAVRELSERFDHWSPPRFRLSPAEIEAIIATVPEQALSDIQFAQAQIRRFAEAQREALRDVEVET